MTPRVGVKTTLTNGNAPLGALVPKQGPHFFACPVCQGGHSRKSRTAISACPLQAGLSGSIPKHSASVYAKPAKLSALIYLFGGGNVQLMQYVDNFGISQARCVILKRQPVVVVHSKAP